MQVVLCEINNIKVADTEGKEIEKFTFGRLDFNLYDPKNVFKEHCVKVHFQWPSGNFFRPEDERINNCYDASNPHQPVNFAGTSQVALELEETIEVEPSVRRNPMREKGKQKVVHSPTEEQSRKWKADPIILKEAITVRRKREQLKHEEELKQKEEQEQKE